MPPLPPSLRETGARRKRGCRLRSSQLNRYKQPIDIMLLSRFDIDPAVLNNFLFKWGDEHDFSASFQ